MFTRISSAIVFVFLAFTVFAAATPTTTVTVTATPTATPMPASQCNVDSLECCNSVSAANIIPVSTVLGLLEIAVSPITALVGLTCSPLTLLLGGGSDCTAQPVCCEDNDFNGLIAIGCTPIDVNL